MSTEIFHETRDHFSMATIKDEGTFKHYMRHLYMVVGLFFGVYGFVFFYKISQQTMPWYEDYLDWVIF